MQTNEICTKYCISYTVLNKIKKKSLVEITNSKFKKIDWVFGARKDIIINLIKYYIHTYSHITTAQEIAMFANHELQSDYDEFISNQMKIQVNSSSKKVKLHSNNIDLSRIKLVRKLFALKFAKMVSKKTLMIKIDKSSINRSIMTNYSWELKVKPIESKNSPFSDPLSLIMAICSNGSWMSFMIDETIDSINFIWFNSILHHWIVSNNYYEYNKVLLLLDNWSYHKSNNSMKILKTLCYTIAYIPTYSPDFAPIEMCFYILKRNLKESWKKRE